GVNSPMRNALSESWMRENRPSSLMSGEWKRGLPLPRHSSTLPCLRLDATGSCEERAWGRSQEIVLTRFPDRFPDLVAVGVQPLIIGLAACWEPPPVGSAIGMEPIGRDSGARLGA